MHGVQSCLEFYADHFERSTNPLRPIVIELYHFKVSSRKKSSLGHFFGHNSATTWPIGLSFWILAVPVCIHLQTKNQPSNSPPSQFFLNFKISNRKSRFFSHNSKTRYRRKLVFAAKEFAAHNLSSQNKTFTKALRVFENESKTHVALFCRFQIRLLALTGAKNQHSQSMRITKLGLVRQGTEARKCIHRPQN